MDCAIIIERVYEHIENGHIDKAAMGCLRIARHLKDYLYTAIFLREIYPNNKELIRILYDDMSHLKDEAKRFVYDRSHDYWLESHTLDYSLATDEGEERNILKIGAGDLDSELEQLKRSIQDLAITPGMGEYDTAAFTDRYNNQKAQMRLRISAIQTIKERIKTRCLNYAIGVERQLETPRKTQSSLKQAKNKGTISIGDVKGNVVISQDQSGGTTSYEIKTASTKKPSKSKWWLIIRVISVVASIIAILTYFGVKPIKENIMPKDEEDKSSIGDVTGDVVISQNQSGGITAHTVNIQPTDSYHPLSLQHKDKLIVNLKKIQSKYNHLDIKIFLDTESNNINRTKLETEIVDIFTAAGFDTRGSGNSVIMRGSGGPPIQMLLNPANITFAEELSSTLKQFIDTEFPLEKDEAFPKDSLKIFIKGEPLFSSDGVVTFR